MISRSTGSMRILEGGTPSQKSVSLTRLAAAGFLAFLVFFSTSNIADAEELNAQAAPSANRSYIEFSGDNRYQTASDISFAAYRDGASTVIIASGVDFPDALAATALAGAKDCPILLTLSGGLPAETIAEIQRLGASSAYIVGGTSVISSSVEQQLLAMDLSVKRIEGTNRHGTAISIANELIASDSNSNTLVLSYGYNFADSASISPYAARYHAPILLTDSTGELPLAVQAWLAENGPSGSQHFDSIIITGGSSVVTDNAYKLCQEYGYSVQRLDGANRYQTSQRIVEWSVKKDIGMSYVDLGFASGSGFADALAGGVLQGKSNSAIQLVGSSASALDNMHLTLTAADKAMGYLVPVRFYGGTSAIPQSVREEVIGPRFTTYAISYTDALACQMNKNPQISKDGSWVNASQSEVSQYLNPASFSARDLQFLVLSKYSGVTGEGLNAFLANKAAMAGMGNLFVSAAQSVGINEVYLVMHAVWETGWGTSELAQGVVIDGKKYYNFFGIGAFDEDPVYYGSLYAKEKGWDTPEKAIIGGAAWIKAGYIGEGQDTLYKMRWNPEAMAQGVWGKQYATDVAWAAKIATQMKTIYDVTGTPSYLSYEVPAYL